MPKCTVLTKNLLFANMRVLILTIAITLVKSTNVFIFRIEFSRLTNSRVLISNVEIAIIIREYFLDFTHGMSILQCNIAVDDVHFSRKMPILK